MQDNTPSQFGKQPTPTTNQSQADKEWSELQRDLDMLGRQLAELSTNTAQLGEHFLASLQARFQDVKDRAATYRTATEQQFEQMSQTAASQAESTLSDMRARSTEAAKQVWERSEPLRQGAKDVEVFKVLVRKGSGAFIQYFQHADELFLDNHRQGDQ